MTVTATPSSKRTRRPARVRGPITANDMPKPLVAFRPRGTRDVVRPVRPRAPATGVDEVAD